MVLVCPKRCFLFNDSINLRLLKKQTDLIKKTVHILTMDERGQTYAKEAGFNLKFLPKVSKVSSMSDIGSGRNRRTAPEDQTIKVEKKLEKPAPVLVKTEKKLKTAHIPKIEVEEKNEVSKNTKNNFVQNEVAEVTISNSGVKDNIFPSEVSESFQEKKNGKSVWKVVTGFLIISIAVLAGLFFYVLPKGEVVIFPKSESLIRDLEITTGLAIQAPDATKLILPGTKTEETVTVTQKFESKGKKEVGSKATGQVRIYNFTKLPLNLKASTTTLKLAGRTYVLTQDVNALKPTLYKNAKTKEVDTETLGGPFDIIATEGGEEANAAGDTRMEVTNQVMGSKPLLVYAKTEGPISGGTSRYLSYVSDTDVDDAKKQLIKAALDKAHENLKDKNLVFVENGYAQEIQKFTTDKPSGAESPSFEANLEVKFTGLTINTEQLNQLVLDRIQQTMADNKTLEPIKSQDQFSLKFKEIDPKFDLGILLVHFQGKVWFNLNDNLAYYPAEFKNKTPEEINEILNKDLEIDRVDITVAPSWQKTFPKLLSNIKIRVERTQ